MRIISKIKLILLLACIFLMLLTVKVFAASISVSPSKSSISPGESFSVSITANGATGKASVSVQNGSVSSSSLWLEPSGSVTVTAGSSGTVKISVSAVDMSDSAGNEVSPSGSASVTIVQPSSSSSSSGSSSGSSSSSQSKSSSSSTTKKTTTTNTSTTKPVEEEQKSNNALLASVVIENEGIVLIPGFAKDALEYTVNIPNEINELNITATPEDEKATVEIKGNTDLKVGENEITLDVTAEDGTKQIYTIKVIKSREKLALKTLILKYEDENGEIKELALNPAFISNIYEYAIDDILSYKIQKIFVETTANLEDATIEITGNENLSAGENIITITVKIPKEIQNIETDVQNIEKTNNTEDEVIVYTIKLNKEEVPSFWQKAKDKIKGLFGTITNWFNNNQRPIIMGSLILCIVAMIALSIYILADAKKYKLLLQKISKITEMNNLEVVKEENNFQTEEPKDNIIEEIANNENSDTDDNFSSNKRGRHF